MATEMIETIVWAEANITGRDGKLRMWVGLLYELAGIMLKALGATDAKFVLGAALETIQRLEKNP